MQKLTAKPERLRLEGGFAEFNELAEAEVWGDGLPLVPPTPGLVRQMLERVDAAPDASLGLVPPYQGEATYEKVAVNAVMAGCTPELFPVVCTAVEALLEKPFNLYGIQATTSAATPFILVNGPAAKELNFNSGSNCFGPGYRANATVGRAIRLVLWNIGGGVARELGQRFAEFRGLDYATQGTPAKYTFCTAENEAESPWEPLHVERGFKADESVVSVIGIDSVHDIRDTTSQNGLEVMQNLAAAMSFWGTANMLYGGQPAIVISPELATILAGDGWSKHDVREYLYEHARIDMTKLPANCQEVHRKRRPKKFSLDWLPQFDRPEDLIVLCIGGPGIHFVYLPTFSNSRSVSKKLKR